MRWFVFSFFLLPILSLTNTNSEDFHVCFFELNNETASKNLQKNKNFKSNPASGVKVHTFTPQSESGNSNDISKGFKAMIEKTSQAEKLCDSLVISGHHTGNWYGELGGLKLKELEDLSCDPKYKNWFKNIKALWLDGCNTMTDNFVRGARLSPSPDSESARVSEKETEKGGYVSKYKIRNLNQAYTLSLDKNTPLSSRYLRAFPNTQIYGFNGAAPEGGTESNQVGNTSFIANHLSHIGQALKAEERFLGQQSDIADITLGLTALTSDECDEDRIEAWGKIGELQGLKAEAIENQSYKMAGKLGCDLILAKQVLEDPDSKSAREALAKKIKEGGYSVELLNLANAILSNNSSESQKSKKAVELAKKLVNKTLDTIIEEDKKLGDGNHQLSLTHLLFNNIYETWTTAKKYETKDSSFFNSVKTNLASNNFKASLQNRIESTQTSSIRKADYIKFFIDVNNTKPTFINQAISDLVSKSESLFPELKSPRNQNLSERSRRALAFSVADQLLQYDLLSDGQKRQLLNSSNLFPRKTDDAFHLSVNAKLRISRDEKAVLGHIKNNQGSEGYRLEALKVLTEKYFQNEDTAEAVKKFQNMMNEVVDKNITKENSIWEEMHFQLQYKTKDERIKLMSSLINDSDKKEEYTRAFVSEYAQHLPSDEKTELCGKIIPRFIFYKKNVIDCPE